MSPRVKKLIALAVMLPAIGLYFFAAAALGERLPRFPGVEVLYYLVAGVLWAIPVRYLIIWANREPGAGGEPRER